MHYYILSVPFILMFAAFLTGDLKRFINVQNDLKIDAPHIHWSYEGETAPDYWGELDLSFSACINGTEQSPIDIVTSQIVEAEESEIIDIHYQPTTITIENNGHTIQANTETQNNSIILGGTIYKLSQLHFHTPSEHQLNGESFDMEIHLVHKSDDGDHAVVGIMIKKGQVNKVLSTIWDNLPKRENGITLKTTIDLTSIFPEDKDYFKYNGSLTTPLCTEGVKWVLLKEPSEMSKEQIDAFRVLFANNHRPVQPLNKREVLLIEY